MATLNQSPYAVGQTLPAYTVRAHNASTESDNKIHEDSVAKAYGFRGGLVPGVTVYAYMTRPFAEHLGLPWVEHGTMSARFLKPFYEGDECRVTATVTTVTDEAIIFDLRATNQDGELCGSGSASLLLGTVVTPEPGAVPLAPLPTDRPEAGAQSLPVGTVLGTLEWDFELEGAYADYLAEVADSLPLYRGEDGIAAPGYLVRWGNTALTANVVLGPWVHVSSEVQHFSAAHPGDHLRSAAIVTDLFERKGHHFVDLDVLIVANGTRPVMRIAHRAIYQLRPA
ncbi:MAG: MaoC family dehydratase [Anaerolineaceae bacterium]